MKSPKDIKKALACDCDGPDCEGCVYAEKVIDEEFGELTRYHCSQIYKDVLEYIQQLETRLAQVERERDAMSYDMHQLQGALCAYCENLYRPAGSEKVSCKVFGDGYGAEDNSPLICGKFKWRGVCEENTKEES